MNESLPKYILANILLYTNTKYDIINFISINKKCFDVSQVLRSTPYFTHYTYSPKLYELFSECNTFYNLSNKEIEIKDYMIRNQLSNLKYRRDAYLKLNQYEINFKAVCIKNIHTREELINGIYIKCEKFYPLVFDRKDDYSLINFKLAIEECDDKNILHILRNTLLDGNLTYAGISYSCKELVEKRFIHSPTLKLGRDLWTLEMLWISYLKTEPPEIIRHENSVVSWCGLSCKNIWLNNVSSVVPNFLS